MVCNVVTIHIDGSCPYERFEGVLATRDKHFAISVKADEGILY
jgi:hypothetical protein